MTSTRFGSGLAAALLLCTAGALAQQAGKRQEVRSTDPPWIEAGKPAVVRILGNGLAPAEIRFEEPAVTGKILKVEPNGDKRKGDTAVEVEIHSSADVKPRPHRFTLTGPQVQPATGTVLIDVPAPEISESEPNNELGKPQVLAGPCTVSGKLDNEAVDVFQVNGKAGETWRFEVFSRRIKPDTQLEAVLRLRDPRMAPVRAAVDQGQDCAIEYTLPLDGPYRIELFDGDNRSNPNQVYRLFVRRW